MSDNQTIAQRKFEDVSRTAERLARQMGGSFVVEERWRDALTRREEQRSR